jgi:hypothetical protein
MKSTFTGNETRTARSSPDLETQTKLTAYDTMGETCATLTQAKPHNKNVASSTPGDEIVKEVVIARR